MQFIATIEAYFFERKRKRFRKYYEVDMTYTLEWEDQFEGDSLDDTKWRIIHAGHGFGNNEDQFYTGSSKNVRVKDGKLIIEAHHEDYEHRHYTSAKITTYGKQSFQYGKLVIRAKVPEGQGTWPAIWMLPDSIKTGTPWPECGEIDIMEHVGRNHEVIHASLHTGKYNHKNNTQYTYFEAIPGITQRFADYAILWTKDYIEFLIDDQSFAKFSKGEDGKDTDFGGWPFDEPFYLILNLAIGGYWGGNIDDSIFPVRMEVESVQLYSTNQ